MATLKPDLTTKIYEEEEEEEASPSSEMDEFDRLPDSLLLLIFNNIGDVKSLGRCCLVSKRFHSLVPHVQNVVVCVDCVISDEHPSSSSSSDMSRSPFSSFFRLFFNTIIKPLNSFTHFLSPSRMGPSSSSSSSSFDDHHDHDDNAVTHHSPTQVLKAFKEIRFLRVELPSAELGIDDAVLLKWKAHFGSTLHNCVILGASSLIHPGPPTKFLLNEELLRGTTAGSNGNDDNGSIPESFYTNGGLKLRVVWTISSLIAASARHYLLQPIISEHKTLDSLVLTDSDGQGVLCMNREQLEELRVKPLSASSASKRTLVPALNMRLWYAPHLELPDGSVLKGATLVAIKPSEQSQGVGKKEVAVSDGSWVSAAFEEPFGTAARMLVKRRTYCLEMNSF